MNDISLIKNRQYYFNDQITEGVIYTYINKDEIDLDDEHLLDFSYTYRHMSNNILIKNIFPMGDFRYKVLIFVGYHLEHFAEVKSLLNMTHELIFEETYKGYTREYLFGVQYDKYIALKEQLDDVDRLLNFLSGDNS